jgi:hypothetical protein
VSDATRIVAGLMFRFGPELLPTSVRLERAPAPACWRCGRQLFLDRCGLAVGDGTHPWVWCCDGCLTEEDREATPS